ncbi:hypothetical protein PN498_28190 [Oscillatoria sp. CS-180]|uniref:hypothetical protein n=1 Tax=Oscillatoria sp. CS-180 TaxID=3021720 RepID=UPI00232DA403|nr:hypothetical protein [Oscillatoria sp. CS-180]MDB9529899.1 hypothetical protein [Oscillatoria sp. CS-180]
MTMQFHIPTLEDQQAAQDLKELILTSESGADIEIDTQSKVITIESKASEETFRELIVAAGHSIKED